MSCPFSSRIYLATASPFFPAHGSCSIQDRREAQRLAHSGLCRACYRQSTRRTHGIERIREVPLQSSAKDNRLFQVTWRECPAHQSHFLQPTEFNWILLNIHEKVSERMNRHTHTMWGYAIQSREDTISASSLTVIWLAAYLPAKE